MTAFAEAGALVERYVEAGSPEVRRHGVLLVSALSQVEVGPALARLERESLLTTQERRALVDRLARELAGQEVLVTLSVDPVLDLAGTLLDRHPLRAGDAVQLASALRAREAGLAVEGFLCFDTRLGEAAEREDFRVLGLSGPTA